MRTRLLVTGFVMGEKTPCLMITTMTVLSALGVATAAALGVRRVAKR
jgi:hypothetical protein